MAGRWRDRPVFVSSTFRDMHAERDHLSRFVFPELAERLRGRRHELTPIDLRWGVDTTGATEAESKELVVLKVCLAEIERSRPFFVGLLGDRYGWVAPVERMRRAAVEAGFDAAVAGMSVTALEIEFGALADPERRARTFFYLRDPLPYEQMEPAVRAVFADEHSPDPAAPEAVIRLAALKERVKTQFGDRVRRYRADWDPEVERVTGLDEFGRMVLEDLWAALDAETTRFAVAPTETWQDTERAELEAFIEERSRGFVGRDALVTELTQFALSPPSNDWGTCVVAGPGAGKSALFAVLHNKVAEAPDVVVLAHSAGISTRSTTIDALLERWVGELAAHTGAEDPTVGETDSDRLQDLFAEWLSRVAVSTRVVVLLDALDQFDPTPVARHLTWLPDLWPRNARLVVTTLPGPEVAAFADRTGWRSLALRPLTTTEAAEAARAVCARYHRSLPDTVLRALIGKDAGEGSPAAGNPLWLNLVLEELLLFDEDDYGRATQFAGTPEQQLEALLVATVDSLPADVAGAYNTLLARNEDAFGQAWARAFAELLAASRNGLRETDLRALLPSLSSDDWSDLRFAALRRGFRSHLTQRGTLAQWDFTNGVARSAAEARYLTNPDHRRRVHQTIADHLDGLPDDDPLAIAEHMWHLIAADNKPAAATLLAGDLAGEALDGANRALAHHILTEPAGLTWITQLLQTGDTDRPPLGIHPALVGLFPLVADDLPPEDTVQLATMIRKDINTRFGDLPSENRTIAALAACEDRIRTSCIEAGDLEGAEAAIHRSIDIAEAVRRRSPERFAVWLALTHGALGELARDAGRLTEALGVYRRQLDLLSASADPSAGDAFIRSVEASLHISMGNVEEALGELDAARTSYETALGIEESLVAGEDLTPEESDHLAGPLDHLGQLSLKRGDLSAAGRYLERAVSIRERALRQNPENATLAQGLMGSLRTLVGVHDTRGHGRLSLAISVRVAEIAESLYARQPDSTNEAADLVSGLNNLSICQQAVGDIAGALATSRRALRISTDIFERAPRLLDFGKRLVAAQVTNGGAHEKAGDPTAAREHYLLAVKLADELLTRSPDDVGIAEIAGVAYSRLGGLYLNQGDPSGAIPAYTRWVELDEAAHLRARRSATIAKSLAMAHNSLGKANAEAGDLRSASAAYRRALAVADGLPVGVAGSVLANSHEGLADAFEAMGDVPAALASAQAMLAVATTVHAQNPDLETASRDLAACHARLASLNEGLGDFDSALTHMRTAVTLREALAARPDEDLEDARALSETYLILARMEGEGGDPGAVHAGLVKALEMQEELLRRFPDDNEARRKMASIHGTLGLVDLEAGEHRSARRAFDRALALVEELRLHDPNDRQGVLDLAAAHTHLSMLQAACNETPSAIESRLRAQSLLAELHQADPDDPDVARERAMNHEELYVLRMVAGDESGAAQESQSALEIRQWLYERAPADVTARRDLALIWMKAGRSAVLSGDRDLARARYQAASGMLRQLHAERPDDIDIAFSFLDTLQTLGLIHKEAGDLEAARASFHQALSSADDILRRLPDERRAFKAVAEAQLALGHAYDQLGKRRRADRYMRACQATLRSMQSAGTLDDFLSETLAQLDQALS